MTVVSKTEPHSKGMVPAPICGYMELYMELETCLHSAIPWLKPVFAPAHITPRPMEQNDRAKLTPTSPHPATAANPLDTADAV
eukprot:CAMPEP_0175095646 /NCGR_PEP_ID=MMETSP0086_2-20121207/4278_1 /TAXON_ID=136419 /ORGANISM="Unknown Unknown, Strain D1" /LENGTH=82 /DNA_ID=CAMNT_0016368931 /DNA_START=1150 /DNA_END=1398 /DNA_ORIENTATION=+